MPDLTLGDLISFARRYLEAAGCSPENAGPVARAIALAEARGNRVCGLYYLPVFRDQLLAGIVDGRARPLLTRAASASFRVDACSGFAHPAFDLVTEPLVLAAKECGIALASVNNSYNALALADPVLPLAEAGLIGLCCSNAPACVAPPGGTRPLFGTNPLAFAVPGPDGPPLVIDQSSSAVTKTALLVAEERGEEIPEGWAQDPDGQPTLDPAAGLAGSLLPFGGRKGANISLIVEVLTAILAGATLSKDADPLSGTTGGPPAIGQTMIAIDPEKFAGPGFRTSLAALTEAFADDGLRLPGQRYRDEKYRDPDSIIAVDDATWARLTGE